MVGMGGLHLDLIILRVCFNLHDSVFLGFCEQMGSSGAETLDQVSCLTLLSDFAIVQIPLQSLWYVINVIRMLSGNK